MKKFLIGTIFLGLASLVYSQSSDCREQETGLSGIEPAPMDQMYLDKVSDGNLSTNIYVLEKRASHYDIKENPLFDGRPNVVYRVGFYNDAGKILAAYDHNGKILYASEKYKNTRLPLSVRNSIYLENPDWVVKETAYSVRYNGRSTKKTYNVRIEKGGLSQNLKFDTEGKRLK